MGSIVANFLGKEYSIPEDILTYIDLLDFTEATKSQLLNSFLYKVKEEIKKGNTGLVSDDDLANEIEQQAGRFISKLCEYGIFTRTVSDYLKGNKGYQYFSEVNSAALAKIKSLLARKLNTLQEGYAEANQRAESHVTGMGFSVISGSFINHAIYAAMQASTINKQEKEASARYQKEIDALCSKIDSEYDRDKSQYFNNEYIPNMEAALTVLVYEMLDRYVADLIAHQRFDANVLEFVNIDRSNDLLKNITLSNNKKAVFESAFVACPYNISVYMQALKHDLLDYDSFQTTKVFKQHHHILAFFRENWGEASFPTKFDINYSCVKTWAFFADRTPTDLLRELTDQYATGIVKAYARIAEMLRDEYLCRKALEGFSEDSILAGDSICETKAREYVTSTVPLGVWEQLTQKCGHTDLLDRIKKHFPATKEMLTKGEVNTFLIEELYAALKSAQKTLIEQIAKKKEQAARNLLEAERKQKHGQKIAIIITSIVCAIITFVILLTTIIIPNVRYRNAIALINTDVIRAYESLIDLNGYKDSLEKASSIYYEYKIEKIRVANTGDYVYFGTYEQDNDNNNGKEEIEWLILAKEDNRVLIISRYCLDHMEYNRRRENVTWETCSLRKWLNDAFIDYAFSVDEQSVIPTVTVLADKNETSSVSPGGTTQDKIFLLSIAEVNKYFTDSEARKCEVTDYAVDQGVFSHYGKCGWWLRTPGAYQNFAARILDDGEIYDVGNVVDFEGFGIRPAMWIELNA